MKKYWPLFVITILGIVLRYWHNLDISLWHDEAFSALLIKYSWPEMMYRVGLDVHPPMYYIFLRIWHYVFGDSLLSLRSMSVFFSIASIWAAYAFVKEAFKNEKAAVWAALLIAVNPFQLAYVTEARMYTMGAFFALLAAYFLTKAFNTQKVLFGDEALHMPNLPQDINLRRAVVWNYIGFTASMIIIIYTHYYLFFTAAAIGAYGLLYAMFHYRKNYRRYVPLLLSFIVIVISFLPWLKTFLYQYRQVGEGYWIPQMNAWSIPSTIWDMLLGLGRDTAKSSTQFWLIIVTVLSLYIFYRFAKKTQGFHKWLVILAVLAPFGGALLFALLARLKGSSSSVYLDRYFLFAGMFYSIALAVWLSELAWKKVALGLFAAYGIANLAILTHNWKDMDLGNKPGMAAAANFLHANVEPSHKLYAGTSFEFFNLKYYWMQGDVFPVQENYKKNDFVNGVRPLLFTGGERYAKNISHFAGSAILTDEDLVPNFSEATNRGDTVWLVWTNAFGSNKPEVPKNWVQVDEKGFADIRPYAGTWIVVTEYKVN